MRRTFGKFSLKLNIPLSFELSISQQAASPSDRHCPSNQYFTETLLVLLERPEPPFSAAIMLSFLIKIIGHRKHAFIVP